MIDLISKTNGVPLTLEMVKRHLRVPSNFSGDDALLSLLMDSINEESQTLTRRTWIESSWKWVPEDVSVGSVLKFPIVPVKSLTIVDMDETPSEAGERTDLSSTLVSCVYPSLSNLGSPMIGTMTILSELPTNFLITLNAGYGTTENTVDVNPKASPKIDLSKTTFAKDTTRGEFQFDAYILHLVFSCPIIGEVSPDNVSISINDTSVPVLETVVENDGLSVAFSEPFKATDSVKFSYAGGFLRDKFDNFVELVKGIEFSVSSVGSPSDYVAPDPFATVKETLINIPNPVRQWMLIRIGTLYCQRSEIAQRAGSVNDALFPDAFINGLIAPYRVELR